MQIQPYNAHSRTLKGPRDMIHNGKYRVNFEEGCEIDHHYHHHHHHPEPHGLHTGQVPRMTAAELEAHKVRVSSVITERARCGVGQIGRYRGDRWHWRPRNSTRGGQQHDHGEAGP